MATTTSGSITGVKIATRNPSEPRRALTIPANPSPTATSSTMVAAMYRSTCTNESRKIGSAAAAT